MYKISIVVPMYNAEKYVEQCIVSIINQTIGFENIELIVVDDWSTDNSVEMVKKFTTENENIILLRTKQNTGVAGNARNVGVQRATGKYLMFSDADDFLKEDACEILYNFAEEKNADFVTGNYQNADED